MKPIIGAESTWGNSALYAIWTWKASPIFLGHDCWKMQCQRYLEHMACGRNLETQNNLLYERITMLISSKIFVESTRSWNCKWVLWILDGYGIGHKDITLQNPRRDSGTLQNNNSSIIFWWDWGEISKRLHCLCLQAKKARKSSPSHGFDCQGLCRSGKKKGEPWIARFPESRARNHQNFLGKKHKNEWNAIEWRKINSEAPSWITAYQLCLAATLESHGSNRPILDPESPMQCH